jgi:hypothetical protein
LALGRIEDQYQFAETGVIGETFLNSFTSPLFTIAFNTARGSRQSTAYDAANDYQSSANQTGASGHSRATAA